MKKSFKWPLSILLAVCMLVGMIPAFSLSASAAEVGNIADSGTDTDLAGVGAVYTETDDPDLVLSMLTEDGDAYIRLTDDVDWDDFTGCTLGDGTKVLDLNDNRLYAYNDGKNDLTMFSVYQNTTFIVNDSGKNKDGEIYFNGYMYPAANGVAGSHTANYRSKDVVYRNGIKVIGGTLIRNGGELHGGRSKEQYLGYGLPVDKIDRVLYDIVPFNVRYDGYVRQQINCQGITQYGGTVIVNGGTIESRGFSYMNSDLEKMRSENVRAAAIRSYYGTLIVNNGYFTGKGCANAFSVDKDTDLPSNKV